MDPHDRNGTTDDILIVGNDKLTLLSIFEKGPSTLPRGCFYHAGSYGILSSITCLNSFEFCHENIKVDIFSF